MYTSHPFQLITAAFRERHFFLLGFLCTTPYLYPVETGLDAVKSALSELLNARLDFFHSHRARRRERLHHNAKPEGRIE